MHLFYQPEIDKISVLSEEEAHHAFHVLRLRDGDKIGLLDGKGKSAVASIQSIHKRGVTAEVLSEELTPPPARTFHLAIAPVKNMDRFEWLVEKATEMGVSRITPVICRRSERKELKTDRLQKLIIAASKQSKQSWFPVLEEPLLFSSFIKSEFGGKRFIAHCMDGDKVNTSALRMAANATMLIGPEGDFDEAEVQAAVQSGFQPISLGETRLRTETAGLVAVVAFMLP